MHVLLEALISRSRATLQQIYAITDDNQASLVWKSINIRSVAVVNSLRIRKWQSNWLDPDRAVSTQQTLR